MFEFCQREELGTLATSSKPQGIYRETVTANIKMEAEVSSGAISRLWKKSGQT